MEIRIKCYKLIIVTRWERITGIKPRTNWPATSLDSVPQRKVLRLEKKKRKKQGTVGDVQARESCARGRLSDGSNFRDGEKRDFAQLSLHVSDLDEHSRALMFVRGLSDNLRIVLTRCESIQGRCRKRCAPHVGLNEML